MATVALEGGATLRSLTTCLRHSRSGRVDGDFVSRVPEGFEVVATSANAPVAAMQHAGRSLYAMLFHPEVVHTGPHGRDIPAELRVRRLRLRR